MDLFKPIMIAILICIAKILIADIFTPLILARIDENFSNGLKIIRTPQFYFDNILPATLIFTIIVNGFFSIIEKITHYSGFEMVYKVSMSSTILITLIYVCYNLPTITTFLTKQYDLRSCKYKKYLLVTAFIICNAYFFIDFGLFLKNQFN